MVLVDTVLTKWGVSNCKTSLTLRQFNLFEAILTDKYRNTHSKYTHFFISQIGVRCGICPGGTQSVSIGLAGFVVFFVGFHQVCVFSLALAFVCLYHVLNFLSTPMKYSNEQHQHLAGVQCWKIPFCCGIFGCRCRGAVSHRVHFFPDPTGVFSVELTLHKDITCVCTLWLKSGIFWKYFIHCQNVFLTLKHLADF